MSIYNSIFFGRKSLTWLFLLMATPVISFAQNSVGIGTREPNPNAALHITSEGDQGILIPSLTTDQRLNDSFVGQLTESENGLLVFDSDQQVFYYWMTNLWQPLISGSLSQNVIVGEGLGLVGDNQIFNTGDTDSTNDITINTVASGDLEGNFPEVTIVQSAVDTEKLAPDAVTTVKVLNNTLLPEDMESPGGGKVLITTSAGTVFWENQSLFGITFLQQGRVYVGNSGNEPSEVDLRGVGSILIGNGTSANAVPVSGDIVLSSTGNTQLQAGSVNSTKISDGAITNTKLAAGAVGTNAIEDNSITNIDISGTANIAGGKISPDFVAQNIVTTGNLNATSATFSAKVASASTVDADPATTLTTKGFVEGVISANSQLLEDGNGINDFNYNGSTSQTISINAGAGLSFGAGDALQVDGVTGAMITNNTLTNDDISLTAGLEISKLAVLPAANLIIGNGTTNTAASISGDATLDATGVLTLTGNAATTLGLGSIASQDANAVAISGGSISGIVDMAIADGGTGASTAADARANLGLSGMSLQDANTVNISGGIINGTAIGNTDAQPGTFTTLVATNLSGDGSALTNLDANNISTGTLDGTRLPDVITGQSYVNVTGITVDNKGRVTAVTTTPSDRRLKTSIEPIDNVSKKITSLRAYSYQLKGNPGAGLQFGLMAQELRRVFPNLVAEREDGYLTVDYISMIPLLLKSIQEQQAQINSLRTTNITKSYATVGEVELLKRENDMLKKEIADIRAALGIEASEPHLGQEEE